MNKTDLFRVLRNARRVLGYDEGAASDAIFDFVSEILDNASIYFEPSEGYSCLLAEYMDFEDEYLT